MNFLRMLFRRYADDFLFVVGVGLVIYATYLLSVVAALYVAGAGCIAWSVLIGISRSRNDHQ